MTKRIIADGHMHVYGEKIAQKIISSFTDFHKMHPTNSLGKGTVEDVVKNMGKYGINYTVTANFAPQKSVLKNNEWTLKIASENKGFIPLVSVYPKMPLEIIDGYFENGAKGIKMHTGIQGFEPTDEGLKEIYEYCENKNIPITFHCGETSRVHMNEFSEVSHIIPVLQEYGGITFVMTHLAAGNPDTVFEIAQNHKNVIFDTSITFTGEHCIDRIHDNFWEKDENAVAAFRQIGCERVAFGSDYPFGNPGSDIKRILNMELTEKEKNLILGENTLKLYKII